MEFEYEFPLVSPCETGTEYPSDNVILAISYLIPDRWYCLANYLYVDPSKFCDDYLMKYKAYDALNLFWNTSKGNKFKAIRRALKKCGLYDLADFTDEYFLDHGCKKCVSRIDYVNQNFLICLSCRVFQHWFLLGKLLDIDVFSLNEIENRYSVLFNRPFQIMKIWKYNKTSPPGFLKKFAIDENLQLVIKILEDQK